MKIQSISEIFLLNFCATAAGRAGAVVLFINTSKGAHFKEQAELEPDEKTMVFKMIDTFLTKKKFKDFFNKNVSAL